jgi:hypothetical protein
MNYIKDFIIDKVLARNNITFVLFQHTQPAKYLSIPKDTKVCDIHYEFAKLVDCTAGIRDVIIANDNNMLNTIRLPKTSVTLPIHEYLTLNKNCIDISLHYRHGIAINVFIIDDVCIQNLLNKNKKEKEFELTSVYTEINDETRKNYVDNVIQKISA